MYHFVKGPASRLAMLGTREGGDRDDVADSRSGMQRMTGAEHQILDDDLTAVYTRRRLTTEVRGTKVIGRC